MARWFGKIGYVIVKEPGEDNDVWKEETVERPHYGDILRNARRYEAGTSINDDLVLNNQLSILADGFADRHYGEIRYAVIGGVKWKVTNVEFQRPRLILTLGGVFNG